MNRKEFFKKLGIGAAAIVVAPKILIPSQKAVLTTGGVIPHIARQGGRQYYGIIVSKGKRSGMIYTNSLLEQMEPHMHDIQMSWLRMQVALNKRDGLVDGFKENYQP